MTPVPSERTKVFISYSHADKEWLLRLKRHLKPLVRDGNLDCWDDSHIRPGDDWQQEIRTALDTAQVAVLLISADFFASNYIDETELPPLLTAAQAKGVLILSVIISASRFARNADLARYQAVNSPDQPLAKMSRAEQEEVLDRLAQIIESVLLGVPGPSLYDIPEGPRNVPPPPIKPRIVDRDKLAQGIVQGLTSRRRLPLLAICCAIFGTIAAFLLWPSSGAEKLWPSSGAEKVYCKHKETGQAFEAAQDYCREVGVEISHSEYRILTRKSGNTR